MKQKHERRRLQFLVAVIQLEVRSILTLFMPTASKKKCQKSKSFRYICSKNPALIALSIFRSQLFTGAKEAVRHRGR